MIGYEVVSLFGSYLVSDDDFSRDNAQQAFLDIFSLPQTVCPKFYDEFKAALEQLYDSVRIQKKDSPIEFRFIDQTKTNRLILEWNNDNFDGIVMTSRTGDVLISTQTEAGKYSMCFSKQKKQAIVTEMVINDEKTARKSNFNSHKTYPFYGKAYRKSY